MSNISDFATLFDCTVWPYLGRDRYQNPSWGTPVFLSGKIWYTSTPQKFKDSKGAELISKYKIITSGDNEQYFNEQDYIALDGDYSTQTDPIQAEAHEIMSAKLVKVPFVGLSDELIVMV